MQHDLTKMDEILSRYPREESSLVMVLQDVQSQFRFLPCEALERVATALGLPRSRVFSVATFYKAFSLKPRGKTVIQVCKGTACHVRGAQLLEDEFCRQLGVPLGATTRDLGFTIETVNCVGACAMAPVVIMGDRYHREVKPSQVQRMLKAASKQALQPSVAPCLAREGLDFKCSSPAELLARIALAQQTNQQLTGRIEVCGGPGCLAAGARDVHQALHAAAQAAGLAIRVQLTPCQHPPQGMLLSLTGCQGPCQRGPLVHLTAHDMLYKKVKIADAGDIVDALAKGTTVQRLMGEHRGRSDDPFYQGQEFRVLEYCGRIDPESLDDYLAAGGFSALAKALLEMTGEQVIDAVDQSGLRGRGGAGFPTARKWRTALRASRDTGKPPYVLCNGDEGDPGAFMDRAVMEGSPYQVLEGMILGAFALGGRQGYIYVRNEYPLAVSRLGLAIDTCRAAGLLGDRILGTALSFDVRLSRGGGSFVCGESTALMRSIEGKVGEPRAKYVRSAERGLYDSPTVLNNVETWALVAGIVGRGPAWLSSIGTERSKGTKVFSLVGQIQRAGLVEVPMGATLRHLVMELGGGVAPGRSFKAVQTGGPSGGCLPESMLDLPLDFEGLTDAGSMMGSGGMIGMDDRTCMVDVARYFVDFLLQESCGKCVPCRLGLPQLSHLLHKVTRGEASEADLTAIEQIARGMQENSLCGLGKSAPNPVLSTLRYFRPEYEAHVRGCCPAGVCRKLIRYEITDACIGCLLCIKACPNAAVSGEKKQKHAIDQKLCDQCGICRSICNHDAVRVVSGGGS
jgi:NADH:ubiquinone oxidoreductase subunit F (NADH-binding)/NADH:ubiquinone oxidoreductase subunit E/Pyruvate/2-oxoacid:ferredoxin oxidoreductase delta subunit